MDTIRAREIMASKNKIQVLYQDQPVWIENVNENNIAEVSFPAGSGRKEVPVYMLVEK